MVGKTKMADWKACVRTWERRQAEERKNDKPINPFMREEVCL
jgi:hypothetical protein